MMKAQKQQSGFTIIELLIALVFFSFILIFATASFIQINRSYVRGANIKLVQEQARQVITDITDVMRQNSNSEVIILDNDDAVTCDPRTVNLNNNDSPECRHRLCVGNVRFAWNQAVAIPEISENSWYEYFNEEGEETLYPYHPLTGAEPFSLLRTSVSGQTDADCAGDVLFLDSTELVDSSRVLVQDLDITPVEGVSGSYKISLVLSTIDPVFDDEQDLDFEVVPSDSEGPGVNEFKATICHTDKGSLEFCYVETLSTIVTIR